MPDVEARIDALERQAQEDRHLTQASLAGLSLGISDVRGEVHALRDEVAEFRANFDEFRDEVKTALAEIVRRLPEPPA